MGIFRGSGITGATSKEPPKSTQPKPTLKVADACHLVDKNSRTMMKLCELMDEIALIKTQSPEQRTLNGGVSEMLLHKKIVKLQSRLNRRLQKLARWTDSASEARWKDLRAPMTRSRAIPSKIMPSSFVKQPPRATAFQTHYNTLKSAPISVNLPLKKVAHVPITQGIGRAAP